MAREHGAEEPVVIAGGGLAGSCLAWQLHERGVPFQLWDAGGGSSRMAAGLINPVTGKNFEPSWRIEAFLPEAIAFYEEIGGRLGRRLWHPLPVLRLAANDKEWSKILMKMETPEAAVWVAGERPAPAGWAGAVEVRGGGRLDTRAFIEGTRGLFADAFHEGAWTGAAGAIRCEGAAGLIRGGLGPHRCAKGEILTLRAEDWDPGWIRIGGGGWLVPLGDAWFKAGSTYEWDQLDERPTPGGRLKIEEIARRLGGPSFEVVAHEAAIRPILRRSEPLIGPLSGGGWMFNGLGSKGSLYAPGMARRLADWLIDGTEPEPELDFRKFAHAR